MAWDEIKFKISADMDFGNAKEQMATIRKGITELKESVSEMPNVSRILDNSLEKSATVADDLVEKLEKLQSGRLSEKEYGKISRRASSDILELNALRDIQLGTTDYSTVIAQKWFGNLPNSIKQQFDAMMPQLTAVIRSRMSTLSKYGNGISSAPAATVASVLMGAGREDKIDPAISKLIQNYKLTADARNKLEDAIRYIVPAVSSMNRSALYQQKRHGFIRESRSAELFSGKPEDLFPASFKETFRSQGQTFHNFSGADQSKVLNAEQRKQLNNILRTNPIAVKAALASNISRRDARGILETKDEITRGEWETFRKALYDDLLVRVSGFKGNKLAAYKATGKDKQTLMSRLTSSSSGRAMLAMHDIESFENPALWSTASGSNQWSKLPKEGKRILDQYVVNKYAPFATKDGFTKPRKVMISESHNTRLLGNKQWQNNQDVSDTLAVVSLAGYDEKDPEQRKALEELFSEKGKQIGKKRFIAQSIHGTGKDTIVRMIEKSAYDRVEQQEKEWIANHPDEAIRGIQGSYWRGYDDKEIERLINNGVSGGKGITAKDWGKHLDMLNKPWTPSQEVGIDIGGKRFAVVDTKGFGDGGAWFASSVMPHSGQFRGGVGLKGSAFVFQGNGMRAFGKKTGLLDDQGKLMMQGPDGQMYDVAGYDGIIPLDVVKNKGMLKDENGNFVSGEVASRRMTAMLQRHPMSYHVDYDLEDKGSGHLGTQMASFMMLSPKVREHQMEMAMRIMQELDTEAGQLKHVFSSEDDYLSRKVNEDPSLLSTDEARARVDAKRASIFHSLMAGQYTDFEDDSKIANLRAAASPLASILLAKDGTVPESTIARARYYLEQDAEKKRKENPDYVAPTYSDQDIRDMIILPKGKIIDFNNKDQKNVAVVRAPTGFGNMYNAENLAAAAEPIYRGFGISTTAGMYVSEQDRDRLQTMDFDADQVKAIYDQDIAASVAETLKTMEYKPSDVKAIDIQYTPEELKSWSIQNRLAAERNITAPLGMGTGSSGIRIMQIDYSKPWAKKFVEGAQRMAGVYDIAAGPKAAQTYTLDSEDPIWKALGLGKEYTKFSEKRSDLFKYDEDMLDENGDLKVDHKDIYRASNGKYVNLRALRDMGIDEINLPSRYMANHLMGITEANKLYRSGLVDTSEMDAIYEAMNQKLDYNGAGTQTRRLMQAMRMMRVQFGTGERSHISNTEANYLGRLADVASAEIAVNAEDYLDAKTGEYIIGTQRYKTKDQFIKAQEKKFGVNIARNAIGQFGITENELIETYGKDNFEKNFINVTDSIGSIESDRLTELQEEEEKNNEQIKTLQEKNKRSRRTNKKTAKKKSVEQTLIDKEIKNLAKTLDINENTDIDNQISAFQNAIKSDETMLDLLNEKGDIANQDQISALKESIEKGKARLQGLNKYKALKYKRDHTPEEITLDELLERRAQIEREKEANLKAIDMRTEFEQLRGDAREYSRQIWGYQKGKENKILDSKSMAEKYWSRNYYESQNQMAPLIEFSKKIEASEIPENSKQEMIQGINALQTEINDNIQKDFTNKSILFAKTVAEDIQGELTKEQNAPTAQKTKLDSYNEDIKNAQSFVDFMQNELNAGTVDPMYQKMYEETIKETEAYINSAEAAKANLIEAYTQKNEKNGQRAVYNLAVKQGVKPRNSLAVRSEMRKEEIQNVRDLVTKQHNEGLYSDKEFENISAQLDSLEGKASKTAIAINDTLNKTSRIITSIAARLGRQLFRQALQETKRFVKEYNQQMTTIQMITLKSDEAMSKLGDGLIEKAKELKVSVSEIVSSAATLYRQGLSDQEVEDRLDVIAKFSKVSGTKTDAATKLITVAMNTGLVTDPQIAADIVTALGDNAATNAAEIEKGIEKAGAAAAADGTTFAQLSAMLTAITSTTQIGGNVAGRTLNTIFGRMNKIGTNELIYDENGNAISGSAVATLLQRQGIRMYDQNGNKRSSFDTLYALSQKWDSMSDAEQQQFANAIAGTRQYSNFAAIMQGMSEGKVSDYLDLAESAEGIVDKKYDVYLDSVQASLEKLRSTFDGLIESLADNGAIQNFVDGITTMIQGVDNLTGSLGNLEGALPTIMTLLGAFAGFKIGGGWGALIGGIAGLVGYTTLTAAGSTTQPKSAKEQITERNTYINSITSSTESQISRLRELNNKETKTEQEQKEFGSLIYGLANFADVASTAESAGDAADSLSGSLDDVTTSAIKAANASKEEAEAVAEAAEQKLSQKKVKEVYDNIGAATEMFAEADQNTRDYNTQEGSLVALKGVFSNYASALGYKNFEFNLENLKKLTEEASQDVGGYTGRTEAKEFLTAFSTFLAYASKDNNAPEDFYNKSQSEIYDTLLKSRSVKNLFGSTTADITGLFTRGGFNTISDAAVEQALKFGEKSNEIGGGSLAAQKEGFKTVASNVFSLLNAPAEYIPYLVEELAESFYKDEEIQKYAKEHNEYPALQSKEAKSVLKRLLLGITDYENNEGYSSDILNKSYKTIAEARGHQPEGTTSLVDAEWYYDKVHNNYISKQEAKELLNRKKWTYKENDYDSYQDALDAANEQLVIDENKYLNDELAKIEALDAFVVKETKSGEDGLIIEELDKVTTFKYKDNYYETREEAIDTIEKDIENIFSAAQYALDIHELGLTEGQIVPVKNYFQSGLDITSIDSKNRTTYLADKMLSQMKASGDLSTFVNDINYGENTEFKELTEAIPELALLANAVKVTPEGATGPEGIYEEMLRVLSNNGSSYGKVTLSEAEQAKLALDAYNNIQSGSYYMSEKEARDAAEERARAEQKVAEDRLAKAAELAGFGNIETDQQYVEYQNWLAEYKKNHSIPTNDDVVANAEKYFREGRFKYISSDQRSYLQSALGEDLYNEIVLGDASNVENEYAALLLQRKSQGLGGLTTLDKLQYSRSILDEIKNGAYGTEQSAFNGTNESIMAEFEGTVPGLKELSDGMKENELDAEELAEAIATVEAALNSTTYAAENYGDAAAETAKKIENLKKNQKSANAEIKSMTGTLTTAVGDQYYRQQWLSGKRGNQVQEQIASQLGTTKEGLKALDEETIKARLNAIEVEDVANIQIDADAISATMSEKLSDALANGEPITLNGAPFNIESGPVNLDFSEAEAQLGAFLTAEQSNFLAMLQQWGLEGHVVVDDNGNGGISTKIVVSGLGSGKKTGGGGGGGKSATDKLLEQQKHKLAELEHQQKMLEIQEKTLDFTNDYTGWNTNIDSQVDVQEKLRAQYKANIKEMTDMLAKVKQGSDDWYKLKEAIMSAEEALESINNTINEINAKRINLLQQQQENEDKPASHRMTMLQKYAARYQKSDQFEGYVAMMEQVIATTREQISQNNKQISEWEKELLQLEEGSDSWIEVRDKIWAIREENAELENQVASDTIDLQEARIAQITKDLENAQSPYQHAVNMLETYGGMYQSMNNQTGYRETLEGTIESNQQLKALNDAAIEELKKQIEGMKESDPARQSAISTLYQLEEASAKYEASILSNRQAIEESLVNELKTAYSDSGSILDHELKLLSEAEKEFTRNDDFVNYENILQEEARNAAERIDLQKKALSDYLALQESGQITEGSQQWKDLEETIRTTKETIASYSNEYEELIDKIQNAKFENLQKTFTEADDLAQHNLKMIQYEETKYQNRGELTNYGTLLSQDTEMQKDRANEISSYIENLKEMQKTVEDNPELYKKITQEIYKWEEQLSSVNNTIEKNDELLHKNEEAIRKVRKSIEDTVDKEIRARIQKERDMLSATVQTENSILEVIRKNKQEEWNLEKKTLDLKKQALNEEKNLINERLNARKNAVNQENKYEELAELRRQYALISSDTTRTKDANELRKKIKDLEQELAFDVADQQASAAIEAIDDQIKAIDSYVSTYEEDLNEMLSDSNNFRDDLNKIMGGSFEDFLAWMQENNESYKLATADARKTMEQGWEDTWKKMKGEIDTYWNKVDESMKTKEGFLAYMQNSDTYKTASATGQQSLLAYWADMYDDYTASLVDNADFDHTHEILDKVDELKDWTFNVRLAGLEDYDISGYSSYYYNRNKDYEDYNYNDSYAGVGYVKPVETATSNIVNSSSGAGNSSNNGKLKAYDVYDEKGVRTNYKVYASSPEEAYILAQEKYGSYYAAGKDPYSYPDVKSTKTTTTANSVAKSVATNESLNINITEEIQKLAKQTASDIIKNALSKGPNAEGGLVDYTGLTWVDGTIQRPESFLDATDTKLLRSMLDTFTYVKTSPYISHIDTSNFGKPNVNVGDVNVNLYEAKLEDDADYDKIAQKVGQAFTKELQKDGFNLVNYSW